MTNPTDSVVHVRYMVDDVPAAVDFYTTRLGFSLNTSFPPAFADVQRGNLRLLLSGPASSAGRPLPDGRGPGPGGRDPTPPPAADLAAQGAPPRGAWPAWCTAWSRRSSSRPPHSQAPSSGSSSASPSSGSAWRGAWRQHGP